MLKSKRITACCLKFGVKWDKILFEVTFDLYFYKNFTTYQYQPFPIKVSHEMKFV